MTESPHPPFSLALADDRLPARRESRARAQRALPTDRLKLEVQQGLLRAYATLSGGAKRAVNAEQLSRSVNISPTTAGLCNAFFVENGWIERKAKGQYTATDALLRHNNMWAVSPGDSSAWEPLRDPMKGSWYWQTLAPAISTARVGRKDALILLMQDGGASPAHKKALENILDWLVTVGLLGTDGEHLFLQQRSGSELDRRPEPEPPAPEKQQAPAQTGTAVPQPTVGEPGTAGVFMNFNFHVWLSASDLERMQPEQIRATFDVASKIGALAERQRE